MSNIAVFTENFQRFDDWKRNQQSTNIEYFYIGSIANIVGYIFHGVIRLYGYQYTKNYHILFEEVKMRIEEETE